MCACVAAIGAVGSADGARWTTAARNDALARAVVWQAPDVSPNAADLSRPPDKLPDDVTCTFKMTPLHGSVPKFTCALPSGELLRVKYAGPEPHGEVAASRLLLALGFGADHVGFVRRVRCHGCPWSPFATIAAVTLARAGGLYERVARSDRAVDFEWVSVERRFDGEKIETDTVEGWTFHEFARVRTASPTHADALRLIAVFLAHWDNKSENQRLICLSGPPGKDGRCAMPMAMLQDVGATFGPRKVNLAAWRSAAIWTDRARCEIGMPDLPHGGATFVPVRVSEAGRRFLAERLQALSGAQLASLFRGARFEPRYGAVSAWVTVFQARVAQIADGPPCPQ
ncbi:hypothetical protein [Luteitalea pratensis]|uniref:hypothetical protein n=1 Tax=Luteitalea pratensis TaxID=1855912 RepID=UPI001F1A46B8|nr:hypothetical protein [Luteitalea pratensis]